MKATILFGILAGLSFGAATLMFTLKDDSHLSELGDVWWIPIPLGVISLVLAVVKRAK